jgi:Xaa-Pro aminopeptidase
MKSDIDNLMQERDIDAILVAGPGQHNPPMYYLTGGAHLTNAILVKKRGEPAQLFCYPMEREEAARTGLTTRNLGDYNLSELLKQHNGNQLGATVALYQRMLEDLGIAGGRMGLYGRIDAGSALDLFSGLQQAIPGLRIVGEYGNPLIVQAMATKDEDEVNRMRRMGQVTTQVVGKVAEFLASHPARDGVLVKTDGQPLTIGEVKKRINLWLAELGADNPEGTIFSIGRDAGIPHSTGGADDLLQVGKTIVFDIFPCEAGGGYFYDFTRTWCLGYAPDDVLALYEDVHSAFKQVMSSLQVGTSFKRYQELTCEIFEAQGHPTVKSNPQTQEGYVHSVGHGLGLNVHERPSSGANASEGDRLDPGVVVTIEPGLYYPDRGMGVRLEDTVWFTPGGQIEILAPYPLDLVIPIKANL